MLQPHGMNLISTLQQGRLQPISKQNVLPVGAPGIDVFGTEMTMALSDYFVHHRDVIPLSPSGRAKQQLRPGLLRRLLDALVASRLQQAEQEIARYLESTGGKFTDSVEREIEEHLYPHRRDRFF
jgi:hypothetical protein